MTVTSSDIANNPDLPEDTEVWERRMRALTMRNAGATFAKIGDVLGIAPGTAREDVRKAMAEVVQIPVDEMVARQRAILVDITRVNYSAAMGGDNQAQSMLIKVLEHEARLFGLYAPQRVSVGISEAEFAAQASELLKVLGTEPLQELAGVKSEAIDAEVTEAYGDDDWSNL